MVLKVMGQCSIVWSLTLMSVLSWALPAGKHGIGSILLWDVKDQWHRKYSMGRWKNGFQ